MADEFMKGLGILVTAGLGWMTIAGWYNTPSFGQIQLIQPAPENLGAYGELALLVKEVFFWTAIFGALAFWVVIPAFREARNQLSESES